jgi:hypothetical protein
MAKMMFFKKMSGLTNCLNMTGTNSRITQPQQISLYLLATYEPEEEVVEPEEVF